jgi:hypothetical protein
MTDPITRARAYIDKMPPAVSGQHGHDATFRVAISLVHGFGLSESDAMTIMEEYSARCSPPWSRKELEHKLSSAAQHARSNKSRGQLRNARHGSAPVESPPRVRQKKKISLCLHARESAEPSRPPSEMFTRSNSEQAESGVKLVFPCAEGCDRGGDGSAFSEFGVENEAEARRIAAELNRLHRHGAIASKSAQDTDAAFYARLLRDFGATYIGRRP